MTLTIKTTSDESMTTIAAAICEVWESDVDTPAVYAEHCRVHAADLHHSVIARDESGQLAGVGILCRRGERGFVLDFGVAPAFRQKGYGRQLFAAMMKQIQKAKLREVSLLVSIDNDPAQRIYQRAGFEVVRTLDSLRGRPRRSADSVVVHAVPGAGLASTIAAWYGAEFCAEPQWERELAGLLVMANAFAFTTQHGFVMGRVSPYHQQVDIVHMGLAQDATSAEVNGLLCAVGAAFDSRFPVALLEEPVDSSAFNELHQLGFRSLDHAYLEMKITLG